MTENEMKEAKAASSGDATQSSEAIDVAMEILDEYLDAFLVMAK